eukprot:7045769-Pyramimonas_sp.AAC.2
MRIDALPQELNVRIDDCPPGASVRCPDDAGNPRYVFVFENRPIVSKVGATVTEESTSEACGPLRLQRQANDVLPNVYESISARSCSSHVQFAATYMQQSEDLVILTWLQVKEYRQATKLCKVERLDIPGRVSSLVGGGSVFCILRVSQCKGCSRCFHFICTFAGEQQTPLTSRNASSVSGTAGGSEFVVADAVAVATAVRRRFTKAFSVFVFSAPLFGCLTAWAFLGAPHARSQMRLAKSKMSVCSPGWLSLYKIISFSSDASP